MSGVCAWLLRMLISDFNAKASSPPAENQLVFCKANIRQRCARVENGIKTGSGFLCKITGVLPAITHCDQGGPYRIESFNVTVTYECHRPPLWKLVSLDGSSKEDTKTNGKENIIDKKGNGKSCIKQYNSNLDMVINTGFGLLQYTNKPIRFPIVTRIKCLALNRGVNSTNHIESNCENSE